MRDHSRPWILPSTAFALLLLASVLLGSCQGVAGISGEQGCGDGTCDSTESCFSCEADCGRCCAADVGGVCCGDGNPCSLADDAYCQCRGCAWDDADCNGTTKHCGDFICEDGETPSSCPHDCQGCGDHHCDLLENESNCPTDCSAYCGDGQCSNNETESSCPSDCASCGDGTCSGTETPNSCPTDCDCSMLKTFQDCSQCLTNLHPDAAQLYYDLVECVICEACYYTCNGNGSGCPAAPPTKNVCDVGSCGSSNDGCIACSFSGMCATAYTDCGSSQDCVDFSNDLALCPTQ